MTELPAYPTDAAICRLLAGGPLPTAAIVDRLAMPDRTVRYRLAQLRRAEVVVTGPDKLHRLAAGPLPANDDSDGELAAADPAPALPAGPLPALAAGPLPANDDSDGELAAADPAPATIGSAVVRFAFVALAVGCVGAVIWVSRHSAPGQQPAQVAPPPSPAWPSGLGWSGPGSW